MSPRPEPGVYLDRMRQNIAAALAEGANPAQLQAHLLAVTRGVSRPTATEYVDGVELAELVEVLNGFRSHQPGELPDPMHNGARE
jgi:hypothetical protein